MAQEVIGADPAGDLPKGVVGQAQLFRGQFQVLVLQVQVGGSGVASCPLEGLDMSRTRGKLAFGTLGRMAGRQRTQSLMQ